MGNKVYYYVYCNGILGIKTNKRNFKWIYGSVAPLATAETYDACLIKFDICFKPERKLSEVKGKQKFQSYTWDSEEQTIFCRRTLFGKIKIGYNMTFSSNQVFLEIGENYDRFVQKRVMNLHGVYYLLSDIANLLLLKNGLLTLYASAVWCPSFEKGIVCFAAPNTGKTVTATQLCKDRDCYLVGEDIVITDGEHLFACPWTCSYRGAKTTWDSGGAVGRKGNLFTSKTRNMCDITDLAVLITDREDNIRGKDEAERLMILLNGYLFHYYNSPIIKILGFFEKKYDVEWYMSAKVFLERMAKKYECHVFCSQNPLAFSEIICHDILSEEA